MPISVNSTAAQGPVYGDIRAGAHHNIHQIKLNASGLASARDADGYLPVGLPVRVDGTPVGGASQTIHGGGFIGPEAVKLGAVNIFANVIMDGPINRDMIEDNLGRVLSANELSAIAAAAGFVLVD